MTSTSTPGHTSRWGIVAGAVGAVLILIALVHWGGTAKPGPEFALGVAIYMGVMALFAAAIWWFYLSPLPAGQRVRLVRRSAALRQTLAALVAVGGLLFMIGAFWDETWHRIYGVATNNEDFWWRPHLLIYGSLTIVSFIALGSMATLVFGKGSMRQRFRAEPLMGLLALACGYMVLTTPTDPLWHALYGIDLTAWSLPHLSLGIALFVLMLAGAAVQLSLAPLPGWKSVFRSSGREWLAILMLGFGLVMLLQFATAEWDGLTSVGIGETSDAFWSRPEWLYPVLIASVTAFLGSLTLHMTQRIGASTAVALIALGVRLALLGTLNGREAGMSASGQIMAIAPMLTLDIWYALRRAEPTSRRTRVGGGLAVAASVLLIDLPLISVTMVYPRVNGDTLPLMIGFTVLLGLFCAPLGASIGGWLGTIDRPKEADVVGVRRAVWIGVAALVASLVFTAWFILTAVPPQRLN
ncbi:MAG: hypothetical protein U0452_09570 [Anaerolineae bacterium]